MTNYCKEVECFYNKKKRLQKHVTYGIIDCGIKLNNYVNRYLFNKTQLILKHYGPTSRCSCRNVKM